MREEASEQIILSLKRLGLEIAVNASQSELKRLIVAAGIRGLISDELTSFLIQLFNLEEK